MGAEVNYGKRSELWESEVNYGNRSELWEEK